MSRRRAIISLAASVIIGIACIATVSTDAIAFRGGGRVRVHHGIHHGVRNVGVQHGGAYSAGVNRGAAVRRGAVAGAAVGAAAATGAYYYGSQCGYYPYPPCY